MEVVFVVIIVVVTICAALAVFSAIAASEQAGKTQKQIESIKISIAKLSDQILDLQLKAQQQLCDEERKVDAVRKTLTDLLEEHLS